MSGSFYSLLLSISLSLGAALLIYSDSGTTVRKLLCKADGNFQRADPKTLDLLPLNPQALPSNQVAKRTREDMSAAGGNSLDEVSMIPTSPTGSSPKRVKHSPPNPAAFDPWGARLGAPTAYMPIQPARPVTISNSAAVTTGVAPTPTSFGEDISASWTLHAERKHIQSIQQPRKVFRKLRRNIQR